MPVCLGIDWSQAKHDAVFLRQGPRSGLNEAWAIVAQLTASHLSSPKTPSVRQLTWFVIRKREAPSKKEKGSPEPVSRTPG
jgi:hypothetical protein